MIEKEALGLKSLVTLLSVRVAFGARDDAVHGGRFADDIGKPHPRVYGAFPRVLGKYVREDKALTLEEALRKMTSKPAEVFGFKGRGKLQEGYFADIVIFNPDTVIDKGDYVNPIQYPEGIEYVLINGSVAKENGKQAQVLPGRVVRRGRQ